MKKKIKRGSQIGKEGRGGKRINHYAALNLHRETAVQTHRSRIVKQWGCLFTSHRISYITRQIKEIKWALEGERRLILFELIKRLHLWNRFMQTFCLLIFSCFMNKFWRLLCQKNSVSMPIMTLHSLSLILDTWKHFLTVGVVNVSAYIYKGNWNSFLSADLEFLCLIWQENVLYDQLMNFNPLTLQPITSFFIGCFIFLVKF